MLPPLRPWFHDEGSVLAFARHLADDEGWTAREVLAVIEKPWKWTAEYMAWAVREGVEK